LCRLVHELVGGDVARAELLGGVRRAGEAVGEQHPAQLRHGARPQHRLRVVLPGVAVGERLPFALDLRRLLERPLDVIVSPLSPRFPVTFAACGDTSPMIEWPAFRASDVISSALERRLAVDDVNGPERRHVGEAERAAGRDARADRGRLPRSPAG
jgi:hypothetical protein